MFEHICRTCLIHHKPTCQPEEMLCVTCSSDARSLENFCYFTPDSALCKHARSSQRPPSIIAFQRPRPPFVVGLFRPLLAKLCLLFLPPPPQSQSASQFSAAVADGALLFSPLGNFGDVSGAAINLLWWRSGGAWATLPSLVDVPEQERRLSLPVRSNGQAPVREVAKKSGWKVMGEGY